MNCSFNLVLQFNRLAIRPSRYLDLKDTIREAETYPVGIHGSAGKTGNPRRIRPDLELIIHSNPPSTGEREIHTTARRDREIPAIGEVVGKIDVALAHKRFYRWMHPFVFRQ